MTSEVTQTQAATQDERVLLLNTVTELQKIIETFALIRRVRMDWIDSPDETTSHETRVGEIVTYHEPAVHHFSADIAAVTKLGGSKAEVLHYHISLGTNGVPEVSIAKSGNPSKQTSDTIIIKDLSPDSIKEASQQALALKQRWSHETGR